MEVHGAPLLLRVVLVHTVVHVPYPRLDVHDRVLLGVPGEDQLAGLVANLQGVPCRKDMMICAWCQRPSTIELGRPS